MVNDGCRVYIGVASARNSFLKDAFIARAGLTLNGPFSLDAVPKVAPPCDCEWPCSTLTMLPILETSIPQNMASRLQSKTLLSIRSRFQY